MNRDETTEEERVLDSITQKLKESQPGGRNKDVN